MITTNVTSRHVWQVAELVQRLDRDEIQALIQLVPRLREEATGERDDLVEWAREHKAQYTGEARSMQEKDAFIGDMTVEAYFALPEAKRERIWDELYAVAIETAQERKVKPDAVVPAR